MDSSKDGIEGTIPWWLLWLLFDHLFMAFFSDNRCLILATSSFVRICVFGLFDFSNSNFAFIAFLASSGDFLDFLKAFICDGKELLWVVRSVPLELVAGGESFDGVLGGALSSPVWFCLFFGGGHESEREKEQGGGNLFCALTVARVSFA